MTASTRARVVVWIPRRNAPMIHLGALRCDALDMEIIVLPLGLALLFLGPCLAAGIVSYRSRDRWTGQHVVVATEGGAFREGAGIVTPARVPGSITATAAAGYTWAAFTAFVLAPAGALLVVEEVNLGSWSRWSFWSNLFGIFVGLVVVSGIVQAVAIVVAATRILRRTAVTHTVRAVALHVRAHHLVAFAGLFVVAHDEPTAAAALGVICALGWAVGHALDRAADRLEPARSRTSS